MNDGPDMAQMLAELPPLARLLTAYAKAPQRRWHALCWTLDQRLAAIVRRGGEPTIAAIRLAWWDAVLVEGDRTKGGGEPLVEAWRRAAPEGAGPATESLIDGWRALLGAESLSPQHIAEFGGKRGGGLFRLIANADDDALMKAGAVWALWDLAAHVSEPGVSAMAMDAAQEVLSERVPLAPKDAPKPLRLLYGIAAADIRAGRVPDRGFTGRHYRALLWRSLFS